MNIVATPTSAPQGFVDMCKRQPIFSLRTKQQKTKELRQPDKTTPTRPTSSTTPSPSITPSPSTTAATTTTTTTTTTKKILQPQQHQQLQPQLQSQAQKPRLAKYNSQSTINNNSETVFPLKVKSKSMSSLKRKVTFNESIDTWETYEKYKSYFSEYDRSSNLYKRSYCTETQRSQIKEDIVNLRKELFPNGDWFKSFDCDSLSEEDTDDSTD